MASPIREYLLRLYPPEGAQSAYEQVIALLQRTKERLPPTPPRPQVFSEQDIVLITYGDTLRQPNEAPLQSLHRFARRYLQEYISTLHLLPFYPYTSDDGFSVLDYYAVNPDLGTWADIAALGRDFRLMFDAVINHMSAQSDWFKAFLRGDPAFRRMFRVESPQTDLSLVTRPRTTPLLTPFQTSNGETMHVWTTFSADQVDLDYRDPMTLIRILEVLLFYVEKGAQIIRLDAIAFLWKIAGTSCLHLEETHLVIRLMRAVLDEVAPQVILITETNVPHQENITYFGDGYNEAQMVYNFALPPLLLHTLLAGDTSKLRVWINSLSTPSERTTFLNFTASHDGIGVRPVEAILTQHERDALVAHTERRGGRVSYKTNPDGSQTPYELNITYIDALADPSEPLDQQVGRFMVSQAIMLGLAGVPAIYIHSLLGSRNDTDAVLRSGQNRAINRTKLHVDAIEQALADQTSFRARIFNAYTALIRLRRNHPAFHPKAAQHALDLGKAVLAVLRAAADGESRVLCLYNVTAQPQPIELGDHGIQHSRDLISGEAFGKAVVLKPYQILWLEVQQAFNSALFAD